MATIKIPTKFIILALIITFAGFLTLGWYLGFKKTKDTLNRLKTAEDTILFYKAKIGRDSVFLAQTEQKLVSERKLRKELEITNRDLQGLNLKNINEISRLNLKIGTLLTDISHNGKIISILTEKIDSLSNDTINVKKNAILLPFEFVYPPLNKPNPYLSFKGNFDNNGELSMNLEMNLSVDVITGLDKNKKPTCVLKTDCPYIKTLALNSYKTDTPKPKRFGIGVFAGYGVSLNNPSKPSFVVGGGIDLNLIRF